ncbi:hypothetical protein A2U01_0043883, partial [Trifolium medium]|nr:hypothetical protein [Trifolium medium]
MQDERSMALERSEVLVVLCPSTAVQKCKREGAAAQICTTRKEECTRFNAFLFLFFFKV